MPVQSVFPPRNTLLFCLSVFWFLLSVCVPPHAYGLDEKAANRWYQDIDYWAATLEQRHIDLFHTIPRDDFYGELEAIKADLPILTEEQLYFELMTLAARVGDGHTQFSWWGGPHTRLPFAVNYFGEELRVVATSAQYRSVQGWILRRIAGVEVEALRERLDPALQGVENAASRQYAFTSHLTVVEVLMGAGIVTHSDAVAILLEGPAGELREVSMRPISGAQWSREVKHEFKSLPDAFILQNDTPDEIGLAISSAGHTAYIDFRAYPNAAVMEKFAGSLGGRFQKAGVQNVIIDLRRNGGGDFFVGLLLAWGLITIDQLDWREGIYVLTSSQTFSAAASNAVQFRQILNARLVGEPTGANPYGYQDAGTFTLPNSGWRVMYSKRLYRFQQAPTEGVQPDIYLPPSWQPQVDGNDNQLAWILSDIKRRTSLAH